MASEVETLISDGYAVGYAPEKGRFRVVGSFTLALIFFGIWMYRGHDLALVLFALFAASSYYFFPLVETRKARLGAGQYGMFLEGLGIIPWGAIKDITLNSYYVRTMDIHDLHIALAKSPPKAMLADWRSLPWPRLLMRLPWSMNQEKLIKVNLEPFGNNPQAIVDALNRQRRLYGL